MASATLDLQPSQPQSVTCWPLPNYTARQERCRSTKVWTTC